MCFNIPENLMGKSQYDNYLAVSQPVHQMLQTAYSSQNVMEFSSILESVSLISEL